MGGGWREAGTAKQVVRWDVLVGDGVVGGCWLYGTPGSSRLTRQCVLYLRACWWVAGAVDRVVWRWCRGGVGRRVRVVAVS